MNNKNDGRPASAATEVKQKGNKNKRSNNQNYDRQPKRRRRYNNNNDRRQRRQEASLPMVEDPLLSLNLNLDALVQAQASDRAQELYTRIRALHADGYYATSPDVVSFNTVLKGLAHAPNQALDFWHEQVMFAQEQHSSAQDDEHDADEDNHDDDDDLHYDPALTAVQPNVRSFNTILLSLAKAGLYEPAVDILQQMRQFDSRVVPDVITYNTILLAFCSNAETPYSDVPAELAQDLLEEMISSTTLRGNDGHGDTTNDDDGHEHVGDEMDGSLFWDGGGSSSSNPAMDQVEHWTQVETLTLKPAVPPDVISFNTVIAAWARRGNALKALEWLERLKTYSNADATTETKRNHRQTLRPDAYSYTTVIQALATQRGKRGKPNENHAELALSLLQEMLQQSSTLAPNIYTYTAVVRVLCKNRQPDKAHELVQQMWQHYHDFRKKRSGDDEARDTENSDEAPVCPNVVTYSSLLQGWSKVAAEEPKRAVGQAQAILQEMKSYSRQHPEVAPNEYTYTALLNTLAQARLKEGPQLARQIMKQDLLLPLQKEEDQSHPIAVYPSLIHFNAWLDVVAKAPLPQKAVEAAKIYNFMVSTMGIAGDSVTFNTILSAAANAFGPPHVKQKSLEIGRAAYVRLTSEKKSDGEDAFRPNSLTYLNMMKMIRKYNHDDIDEWRSVISSCLAHGCLNSICLQYLQQHAPPPSLPDDLSQILSNGAKGSASLPDAWSRNSLQEKAARKRSY